MSVFPFVFVDYCPRALASPRNELTTDRQIDTHNKEHE